MLVHNYYSYMYMLQVPWPSLPKHLNAPDDTGSVQQRPLSAEDDESSKNSPDSLKVNVGEGMYSFIRICHFIENFFFSYT